MDMEETQLREDVLAGLSVKQLQDKYNCSRSTVYHYKKLYDLNGLSPNSKPRVADTGTKLCNECATEKPITEFHSNGFTPKGTLKYKSKCKGCSNKQKSSFKKDLILEYVDARFGKYACIMCNCTGPYGLLDWHHADSDSKEFTIGGSTISSEEQFFTEIIPELNKCNLLCPNCHRLEHIRGGCPGFDCAS